MRVLGTILLAFFLGGCSSEERDWKLVGTWKCPRNKASSLTFHSGGDGKINSTGNSEPFHWHTKDGSLTIVFSDGDSTREAASRYKVESNGVLEFDLSMFDCRRWNLSRSGA